MINHSTWIFLPEAIMNYVTVYYQLQKNPCKQAGTIGKSDADAMQIWTLDQFECFIDFEDKAAGRLAFNVFFWTGIREGELLALTIEDFTYNGIDEYRLNIAKNFEVVKGIQYLLTPKTDSSRRCITIPQFLYNEAMDYYNSLYEPDPKARLFYFTKNFLIKDIKRVAKLAGLEPIRVNDIRHPYVKTTTKNFIITIQHYQKFCQQLVLNYQQERKFHYSRVHIFSLVLASMSYFRIGILFFQFLLTFQMH